MTAAEALGKTTVQLSILLRSWQSRSIKARCLALIFWPSLVMISLSLTRLTMSSNQDLSPSRRGSGNSSPHTDIFFFQAPLSHFVFNLCCPYFTFTGRDTCWTYTISHGRKQEYVCGAVPPRRNGS